MQPSPSPPPCANCGQPGADRFCPACGERRITQTDLSLAGFIRDGWAELTSVDTRLARTLHALLLRPGVLTRDYLAGRRSRYLSPLQLYLLVSLLFFFVLPHTGLFRYDLGQFLDYSIFGEVPEQLVERRLAGTGESLDSFRERFDDSIRSNRKAMIAVLIPLFGICVMLLYARSGRYFIEHLVFSIHFFSAFLLWVLVFVVLIGGVFLVLNRLGLSRLFRALDSELSFVVLVGIPMAALLFQALRTAYSDRPLPALVRTVALLAALTLLGALAFREGLFFVTLLLL